MAFNNHTTDVANHTSDTTTSTIETTPQTWSHITVTQTRDLFWVVPTIIGITVFLVTAAWVLMNMIRSSELTIISVCAKYLPCCKQQVGGDVYRELKDSETESFFLKG